MKPPRLFPNHPDRLLECEEEIEGDVIALVDRAVEACWGGSEALAAIVSVAENLMLQRAYNAETDADIVAIIGITGSSEAPKSCSLPQRYTFRNC